MNQVQHIVYILSFNQTRLILVLANCKIPTRGLFIDYEATKLKEVRKCEDKLTVREKMAC